MKVKLPDEVVDVANKFVDKGFEIYIVGGAVRDLLMGKSVYDWDFTTNATPKEILEIVKDAYYDNKFGTVGIPKSEGRPFEITTFRTEYGYSDSRRPDKISWGKSLEEDLMRRDFTINAMALRLSAGRQILQDKHSSKKLAVSKSHVIETEVELIDPYKGQRDLENKLIRAVRDPIERFSEDALRMMRAIRIASELNFKVDENTLEAIKRSSALIHKISKERVKDELLKILSSPNPSEGIIFLKESGLLQEILPELEKTFGVEQKSPGRHHIYDVGTHSILSLKNCPSDDPIVRLACLIHDIGKPQTYKKLATGVITFYNHEVVSAKIARRIAERLRLSNKDKDRLLKLVRWHQFTVNENQGDSALRRFIRNIGPENIPDMIALRISDRLGGGARETSWRLEEFKKRLMEVQKQPFTVRDLKISGHDVMTELDIKPGPKVGEILELLYNEVVVKKLENTKKTLLARLQNLKEKSSNV